MIVVPRVQPREDYRAGHHRSNSEIEYKGDIKTKNEPGEYMAHD
jgi:hypothetical protein